MYVFEGRHNFVLVLTIIIFKQEALYGKLIAFVTTTALLFQGVHTSWMLVHQVCCTFMPPDV